MKEECLICQAPLEYLGTETLMECALCHRQEMSQTRCINGHYVCNECHTKGMDAVIGYCLNETSKNPVEILDHHDPDAFTGTPEEIITEFRRVRDEIRASFEQLAQAIREEES